MKGLNKYGNISTCVEGHLFASRREARRYQELKFLELAKEISELELQPKFDLVVEGMKVCSYIADFRYKLKKNDLGFKKTIIEDVKGVRTSVFRLKKKLMLACHGIEVLEI